MHKIFSRSAAAFLCLSCLTAIPAKAVYNSPDEITVSLRAMEGGYIPEDNTHKIYVSPEEARSGNLLHFGIFFETDPATADISSLSIGLECEELLFTKSGFLNPSQYAYSEAKEFTHTDGNVYSSKFKPYCFGRFNMLGVYEPGAFMFQTNIREHSLISTWNYDLGNLDENGNKILTALFFGDASDSYSFLEFNMEIPEGTPAGTYPVSFVTSESITERGSTYISSDTSIPDEEHPGQYISSYAHITPAVQGAEIIIADKNPETDIAPVFRYAHDETPFSIQDFPAETVLSYGGDVLTLQTENLLETFEAGCPADRTVTEPVTLRSELSLSGTPIQDSQGNPAALEYHIGLKGDANCDGNVDALDGSVILTYAAMTGSGEEASLTGEDKTTITEQLAFFLADTDTEGGENAVLDAADASRILVYAALKGTGEEPDWSQIM